VSVLALLCNADTEYRMTNVIPGRSLGKQPSWKVSQAAANWRNTHTLTVTRFSQLLDWEICGGGVEPGAPDSSGQVTMTVATFYSSHCHQSRLSVTLEKECVESKFTFSDKLSCGNDTIHTLFGWENHSDDVVRKWLCGNSFVAGFKLREFASCYVG
jgi:hypothetical protein